MDDTTRMMLGQVRKIFDPDWIQAFDNGRITIQFVDKPEAREELFNFVEMYEFTLSEAETRSWRAYFFEPDE